MTAIQMTKHPRHTRKPQPVIHGLGYHRIVAEHPARYTSQGVVAEALKKVKQILASAEVGTEHHHILCKLRANCERCLKYKWHCAEPA